jgi:hypothetical protein
MIENLEPLEFQQLNRIQAIKIKEEAFSSSRRNQYFVPVGPEARVFKFLDPVNIGFMVKSHSN